MFILIFDFLIFDFLSFFVSQKIDLNLGFGLYDRILLYTHLSIEIYGGPEYHRRV